MVLPIIAYGDTILRKKGEAIDSNYNGLKQLIDDMFETMQAASGIGLAAPQVGHSIRLFIVDTVTALKHFEEDTEIENIFEGEKGINQIFINAKILKKAGEKWDYNEGCLSIPKIREDIVRHDEVTIQFMDENFKTHIKTFDGLAGRVIQHEYDHIEGVLFVDYLNPLKKRLIKKKLDNISRGIVSVDYRMKFPLKK